MLKRLWKIAFLPYFSGSPWQQRTCKQMFEHSLGNYGILPLLFKCKPHKIRNFKFSENLRPKKPLTTKNLFMIFMSSLLFLLAQTMQFSKFVTNETWHKYDLLDTPCILFVKKIFFCIKLLHAHLQNVYNISSKC